MKKFINFIFSVKNADNHKVFTILGTKLKFRLKQNYNQMILDRENTIKELKDTIQQGQNYYNEMENTIKELKDTIDTKINQLNRENKQIKEKISGINSSQIQINKKIKRITQKATLEQFEIHITNHCNLNCKSCTHWAPLAEKFFISIEDFTKDMERMNFLTGGGMEVKRIFLLGGEPLLHPNLYELIKIARNLFKLTDIYLVTNGILILSQKEEFWNMLKEYKIRLTPTYYPIDVDYDKIEKTCKEKGILYKEFANRNGNTYWKHPIDLEGKQNPTDNFINCWVANWCVTLKKGKLYTCTNPPHIEHFNKYFNKNVEVTDRDCIDIYKTDNLQEILNFLSKPIPFCRYCNVKNRSEHETWAISKKDISEWT